MKTCALLKGKRALAGLFDTKKKRGNKLVSSEWKINAFQFKPPAGGPVREPWPRERGKRYRARRREAGGLLARNGAWSRPSCSAERLLWTSSPLPHCCAKCGEGWRVNLKQRKFLSFHTLVASLAFNRSQRSPKEAEVTGGRGGGRGRKKAESRGELRKRRLWRNGLEMTPKSPCFKSVLLFKMQTRQIETNMTFCRYLSILNTWGNFSSEKSNYSNAEVDMGSARWGRQVRAIRPEGSEGTWQTLTSLLQSTHSHAHIHLQALPLPTGSPLSISFQPAMRPGENKFSFPLGERGEEGALRYASLFLLNTSGGSSATWSKGAADAGKLTDRGYN